MSTVSTLINNIRRTLQDESDTNYADAELYQYFNDAIDYLSKELARWNSRIAVTTTNLSYAEHAYYASLPAGFLALASNEEGYPRVFNASNNYERLTQVQQSDMDDWENEDNDDDGTVEQFFIYGALMYVHPRASAATTIKIYYHPLSSITDDSSTMPWSGWFDKPVEAFVTRQCRARSEMHEYSGADIADYERLKAAAWDILMLRESNNITMRPSTSIGWTK